MTMCTRNQLAFFFARTVPFLLLFAFFPLLPKAQTLVLYGTIGNELVTIDTSTGLASSVGPFNSTFVPAGNLAYHDGNATLYGIGSFNSAPTLLSFNPATGAETVVAPITLAPTGTQVRLMEGLAYNPTDGLLYGALDTFAPPTSFFSRIFVTLNPTTGVATRITNLTGTCQSEADALIWANGNLFSVDGCPNPNQFYRVNSSSGFSSFRGVVGSSGVGDFAWDPVNGRMFAFNSSRFLLEMDTANGQGAVVGATHTVADFAGELMRGIAFVPATVMFEGLLAFDALAETNGNLLQWEVGTDTRYTDFRVERSWDGAQFEVIGQEAGPAKELNPAGSYAFPDGEAINFPLAFYRLRAIQENGAELLSETIEVRREIEGRGLSKLWPNPLAAGKELHLEFMGTTEQAGKCKLFDALGRLVFAEQLRLREGKQDLKLNLPTLEAGVYFLEMQTLEERHFVRLIIQ